MVELPPTAARAEDVLASSVHVVRIERDPPVLVLDHPHLPVAIHVAQSHLRDPVLHGWVLQLHHRAAVGHIRAHHIDVGETALRLEAIDSSRSCVMFGAQTADGTYPEPGRDSGNRGNPARDLPGVQGPHVAHHRVAGGHSARNWTERNAA